MPRGSIRRPPCGGGPSCVEDLSRSNSNTTPCPSRNARLHRPEAERLEAEHVLVEPLHLVLGLLEEDARTRRLDKSRRGRLAAFWLASGPADSATIDSQPGWFPASTRLGKARYLRSFWPGFAVILFAIRTRMGRQFTRTAACRP